MFSITRRSGRALVAACLAASAVTISVGAAHAAPEACTVRANKQAFSQFGDDNQYFTASGGDFESALTWNGLLHSTAAGNEPWNVNPGSRSLRIDGLGWATSPKFCVGKNEDSVRLFVKKPGVWGAGFRVHLEVSSSIGLGWSDYSIDGSTPGWIVLPRLMIPALHDASDTEYVTITVSSIGIPATWSVDDVMVDPWKSF